MWTELETEQELRTGTTGRGNYLTVRTDLMKKQQRLTFGSLCWELVNGKCHNIFFSFLKACCRISGVLMRFRLSTCLRRSAGSVTKMHTEHVRGTYCDIYFLFPFISTFFIYFPHEDVSRLTYCYREILCSIDRRSFCVPGSTE
jgi:hypothetical protein